MLNRLVLIMLLTCPALAADLRIDVLVPAQSEPDRPLSTKAIITNSSDRPIRAELDSRIQVDPTLNPAEPPDPDFGSDHALGAKSWTELDGKRLEEGSLTDGQEFTAAETPWKTKAYTETFQFLDLGRERRITRLATRSGDANWLWKADVSASLDGKTYEPIESLQNVNLHQQWGVRPMPLKGTIAARYLRLRYHNDGQKTDVIRMPAALMVYDGLDDESFDVPSTGASVGNLRKTIDIPAKSSITVDIASDNPVGPGAYFISARASLNGKPTAVTWRHALVMPPRLAVSRASRFGINASDVKLAPLHGRLGVGWVRFENLKWPMVSPKPGEYRFDGAVAPWHVNVDQILGAYTKEGMSVLPFLFLTADYASSAKPDVPQGRRSVYPPKDYATFGEFCFQTAARYGSATHPADALKTTDKKSALKLLHTFEIWNEPNLNNPQWGPWVASMDDYFELFRVAAESVKKADPTATVTNAGYAGMEAETVAGLATYRYKDGKRPLDFVDVLNVHFYSGRTPPELARIDINVQRGQKSEGLTYEQHLKRLIEWRDKNKPGLPIWLTETGYDTGGPWGQSERSQAARLPRVIMMALGEGIDKVFVYREKGSKPSLHAASGLVREDDSLKPSWYTYATLIRALDGATQGRRLPHPDANVRVYEWKTKEGKRTLAAWAIDGEGKLSLGDGAYVVTDAFGNRTTAGRDIVLTIFPVYIVDAK